MGQHQQIERYRWFDEAIRNRRYPNVPMLARRFEISERTAQRSINYLRDRLGAPLVYIEKRRGYSYRDFDFRIPGPDISQEEILALLIARNLLSHSEGGLIREALNRIRGYLAKTLKRFDLGDERLSRLFSACWHGYSPAQGDAFRIVTDALLEQHPLEFRYQSPETLEISRRIVEPHHLHHYLGSWVLLAWCRTRHDWRMFYLARMEEARALPEYFAPRPESEWRHRIQGAFGIFQGESVPMVLRFTPARAPRIREMFWHEKQQLRELEGGGVELTLPIADLREVKWLVLQHGSEVEVSEPPELREEVRQEIERMGKIYGG